MEKDWKKGKAESAIQEYERQQMAKAAADFKAKQKQKRDLWQELRSKGFTSDQCSDIMEWIKTLPKNIELGDSSGIAVSVNENGINVTGGVTLQ